YFWSPHGIPFPWPNFPPICLYCRILPFPKGIRSAVHGQNKLPVPLCSTCCPSQNKYHHFAINGAGSDLLLPNPPYQRNVHGHPQTGFPFLGQWTIIGIRDEN